MTSFRYAWGWTGASSSPSWTRGCRLWAADLQRRTAFLPLACSLHFLIALLHGPLPKSDDHWSPCTTTYFQPIFGLQTKLKPSSCETRSHPPLQGGARLQNIVFSVIPLFLKFSFPQRELIGGLKTVGLSSDRLPLVYVDFKYFGSYSPPLPIFPKACIEKQQENDFAATLNWRLRPVSSIVFKH